MSHYPHTVSSLLCSTANVLLRAQSLPFETIIIAIRLTSVNLHMQMFYCCPIYPVKRGPTLSHTAESCRVLYRFALQLYLQATTCYTSKPNMKKGTAPHEDNDADQCVSGFCSKPLQQRFCFHVLVWGGGVISKLSCSFVYITGQCV